MISFKDYFLQLESIHPETPISVKNNKTGEIVWRGTYSQVKTARRVIDKKDNKYGASVHTIIYPKGMDYSPSILEYRHNYADGTASQSIQAHNGKNPNIINKKKLHTVGPYKKENPKMNVPGSILTPKELLELGYEYEDGKILNNVKNSGMGIEMTSINGNPVGRVFKSTK